MEYYKRITEEQYKNTISDYYKKVLETSSGSIFSNYEVKLLNKVLYPEQIKQFTTHYIYFKYSYYLVRATKIDDDWYLVKVDIGNNDFIHYKCDQIEGLLDFFLNLGIGTNESFTRINIHDDNGKDVPNRHMISINSADIKIIEETTGIKFEKKTYQTRKDSEILNYYELKNNISYCIIIGFSDEWFKVSFGKSTKSPTTFGSNGVYWCDQVGGVIDLLKELYKTPMANHHPKINENVESYYNIDEKRPPASIKDKNLININDTLVHKLNKILGEPTLDKNTSYYKSKYYQLYKLVGNGHNYISVHAYADDWYIVHINLSRNTQDYWCDQEEGLINCIKDKFPAHQKVKSDYVPPTPFWNRTIERYSNYDSKINESKTINYYYKIDLPEFDKLLYPNKLLPFGKIELDKLSKMDKNFNFRLVSSTGLRLNFSNMNTYKSPVDQILLGEIDEINFDMATSELGHCGSQRMWVSYNLYKAEDEWFVIHSMYDELNGDSWYKCDQFDGLVKFLEDTLKQKYNK